ncbi:hypothetical protein PCA20602_02279 [Pandoraea capi]|uniref:Uncharacterized protein n=1 Tax=Pandoraea capi TaxID=2508286 RepID=A0ABY6VYD0_9BURK|nr:hypothetical protein PCA20602_02279 [Pandoraea capi]
MPFLALAIPQTRANTPSVPIEADGQRHEVVIDMQEIRNQLPGRPQFDPVASMPVSPFASFRPTFECRPIPVGEYFERALAELARCRHRDTSGRATRHSASRQQALSPLDARQNGLTCSIL